MSAYDTDHKLWRRSKNDWYQRWKNGYWLSHRPYDTGARAFYGDVYELPRELGLLGVSIIGSVLEHLRDQISAMASVARLTKTELFCEQADHPDRNDPWWVYTLGTYRDVLKMLGFRITSTTRHMYRCPFAGSEASRHTIVAERE